MTHAELSLIATTLRDFSYPKKLAVELCADCNLACTMCHHPQMKRPKGVMPFELWRKCADETARLAPDTECWFSFCGEPFLQPRHLFDCIRYGRSIGLQSLNINTNGMLVTEELVEECLESGVHLIVFGIDGFTQPVMQRYRVGADRDVVYGNVERLLAVRDATRSPVAVQVQFIVMEGNAHEAEGFKQYWLSRNAVVKVRRQLSWGGAFATTIGVPAGDRIPCPWAITMMHVFWDGRVPRCPGDTEGEEGVGNAWHDSLANLWCELGTYRQKHLAHQFDQLPQRCQNCTDWMTGAAERLRPEGQDLPVEPTCQRV